jgi:septal ring factor EnvC (AmiA/AmiB activator)
MRANKASQMYESNIHSLQQKIEEIEKSFQALEGGIKEQPKMYTNNHDAFNRFTEDPSPMGNGYHIQRFVVV